MLIEINFESMKYFQNSIFSQKIVIYFETFVKFVKLYIFCLYMYIICICYILLHCIMDIIVFIL